MISNHYHQAVADFDKPWPMRPGTVHPTRLKWIKEKDFELPIGKDMDGKPLLTIFKQPNKVQYVESWDDIAGDSGMHPPDMQIDPVDAREALQQLVDLGYIEGIDENKEKVAKNTILKAVMEKL